MNRLRSAVALVTALILGLIALAAVAQDQARREVEQALQLLFAGYAVSYDSIGIDPVSRGVAIGGFKAALAAEQLELSVERIEIDALATDLAASWSQAAAGSAGVVAVGGAIRVRGLDYRRGESSVRIVGLSLDRLALHPWALTHPAVRDLPSYPFLADRLATAGPDGILDFLRVQAAWMLGVSLEGLRIDSLTGTTVVQGAPAGAPNRGRFLVARMTLDRYAPGRLGRITAEGIATSLGGAVNAMNTTIERAILADVDAFNPLTRLLGGAPLETTTFNGLSVGRVEYSDLTFATGPSRMASLGTLAFTDIAWADGIPISAGLAVRGLHVVLGPLLNDLDLHVARQLALDTASLDFGFAYDIDILARRARLREFMFDLPGWGRLDCSFELAEVTPWSTEVAKIALAGARLRYEETSLVDRFIEMLARQQSRSADSVRSDAVDQLRDLAPALGGSAAAAAAVDALVAFVQAPRSVTLQARPARPMGYGLFLALVSTAPESLIDLLGLSLTAND